MKIQQGWRQNRRMTAENANTLPSRNNIQPLSQHKQTHRRTERVGKRDRDGEGEVEVEKVIGGR